VVTITVPAVYRRRTGGIGDGNEMFMIGLCLACWVGNLVKKRARSPFQGARSSVNDAGGRGCSFAVTRQDRIEDFHGVFCFQHYHEEITRLLRGGNGIISHTHPIAIICFWSCHNSLFVSSSAI
jgi:hypothetical protein